MLELKPAQTPASDAGNNITEVEPMTHEEFMAQNPAAKIEYDNKLKAEKEAGVKSIMDISAKAAPFAANKDYPEQIRNAALEVMQGKKSMETLEALVANVDMIKELFKSEAAKNEQPTVTPGQETPALSANGEIKTVADTTAQIKRDKIALGLEV
jgi:hypothetical protein